MDLPVPPQVPYVGILSQNLSPGKRIKIQGTVPINGYRFTVGLQSGNNIALQQDFALHVSINLLDNSAVLNSSQKGVWDEAHTVLGVPIERDEMFEFVLSCNYTHFEIYIDGVRYCSFPQRLSYTKVTHLLIKGDLSIQQIAYPTGSPSEDLPSYCKRDAPPSYSELHPKHATYGSCVTSSSSYPVEAQLAAPVPIYQPYPVPPGVYPTEGSVGGPLSAGDFRPMATSRSVKCLLCICIGAITITMLVLGLLTNERMYRHHHHSHKEWDFHSMY